MLLAPSSPYAPVAQLDRVSVFETEGWEFEPLRARQWEIQFLFCLQRFSLAGRGRNIMDHVRVARHGKRPVSARRASERGCERDTASRPAAQRIRRAVRESRPLARACRFRSDLSLLGRRRPPAFSTVQRQSELASGPTGQMRTNHLSGRPQWVIVLKNSENESRRKCRLCGRTAVCADRRRRQSIAMAARREATLSAEPVALFS